MKTSHETGTDLLFENHTIKEIQEIEKKLRNDIERKKEELRHMVGERYRDLMEAADTITEMKDVAENITSCIKSIESGCVQLQESSLKGGILNRIEKKVAERHKQNSMLYSVASLIKVLMDSSEKIWCFMENKESLNAVSIFLLARHIHSLLFLDPTYQVFKIPQRFPIINRQWIAISHLKYVLMQNCEVILQTQNAEPKDALGPLCCHCLLSNSTLEDVLLKILLTRKMVIKLIFRPEKYAKDQICEFIIVIQMTLQIIFSLLFYEENYSFSGYQINMLCDTLTKITSKEDRGPVSLLDMNFCEAFKFLPNVVKDFRPSLNDPIVPCKVDYLQCKCMEWLEEIKTEFTPELVSLLNYVKSVKNIALIRQAIIENLCETQLWDEICLKLLKKPFSIWDFFLKDCFLERIQVIIHEQVDSASNSCQKDVEAFLSDINNNKNPELEFERNISSYVWLEDSQDIENNAAWISRHHRNFWNSGKLSMKAMGFTPKIQSICKNLDDYMKRAVEDVSTFSCLESPFEDAWLKNEKFRHQQQIVSADAIHTFPCLKDAVKKCISELSFFIESTLLYLKCERKDFENCCRIVFLGHLSHGIANLCSHINTCLSTEKLIEGVQSYRGQSIKNISSIVKECDAWKEIKKSFIRNTAIAFQIWSEHHIEEVFKSIDSELKTDSAEGLLKMLLKWDKVEIQEESEQGNTVKSVLRIPQHISTPLSNALFAFCCSLNEIGGYVINSDIRSDISKKLLKELLKLYKSKIDSSAISEDFTSRLLQVQSLQMLFDVQFLTGLMIHKDKSGDELNKLSQEIVAKAVSHIDPFDMDVFSVPLQQNLKKALQKSMSLYGLLVSPDQITFLHSIKAQTASSQMDHNIMLSSNFGSRFPLLPLSSRTDVVSVTEREARSTPKESEIKISSHRSSPNLNASELATNPMKPTTSFYDRFSSMSSSWFGN